MSQHIAHLQPGDTLEVKGWVSNLFFQYDFLTLCLTDVSYDLPSMYLVSVLISSLTSYREHWMLENTNSTFPELIIGLVFCRPVPKLPYKRNMKKEIGMVSWFECHPWDVEEDKNLAESGVSILIRWNHRENPLLVKSTSHPRLMNSFVHADRWRYRINSNVADYWCHHLWSWR